MKYILTIIVCSLLSSLHAQDINEGLLGHWLFDDEDELIDQSPNELHGVVASAAYTTDRFGEDDEALFFDGQFDYVVFEDALDEVTTAVDAQFSISMWYRSSEFLTGLSPLMCKYAHTGCGDVARQWALLVGEGEGIRFYYASTPDNVNYRSVSTSENVTAEPDVWYHIVANYDGSQDGNDGQDRIDIYVNNILQEDTLNFTLGELGESINDGDAPIGLMAYVSLDSDQCGDFNAPGALDDVRIYDRLLSVEEVDLLFDEGVLSVDENEAFSRSLEISPTLITDQTLTIRSSNYHNELNLELISITGELMLSVKFNKAAGTQTLDLPDLAAGAYFVRLSSLNGMATTKRIVIH